MGLSLSLDFAPSTIGGITNSSSTLKRRKIDHLPAAFSCDKKDTFGSVYFLDIAGLSMTSEMRIFVREDAVNLWNFLGSEDLFLQVQGPPGVGKSLIVWNWGYHSAVEKSKTVFWMHLNSTTAMECAKLHGSGLTSFLVKNFRDFSFESIEADILIIDGLREDVRAELQAEASVWVQSELNRKVIYVGSEQLYFSCDDIPKPRLYQANSWTIEDYHRATKDGQFLAQISTNLRGSDGDFLDQLVEKKHSLAGGCARWMFGRNDDEVENEIRRHVERAPDIEKLVQGLTGNSSTFAVNHLVVRFGWEIQLVSKFAVYVLTRKHEERFIRIFRNSDIARNPAFDGWLLEFDFLTRLKVSQRLNQPLELVSEHLEAWNVPRLLEFRDPSDLSSMSIEIGDWFIPTRWNQGCYDFVQLNQNSLRVVQVTRANSHSIKLRYVRKLITVLDQIGFAISSIDFVVILPANMVDAFHVPPNKVEGQLDDWGWKLGDLRKIGFERTGGN